MLGRGCNGKGFLVERPHADGRRDLALAGWDGGLEVLVDDGQCNAHATVAEDGTLAWSRRHPEAGHWRLVVRRGDRELELAPEPGADLLLPVLSGDGRGVFAVEVRANAAAFTWLPFAADGMPARGHDLTPWMGRPATERRHFQGDPFTRAGNPQCVSPLAAPPESPHEVGYYAGGGARTRAARGEERHENEGIWGVDYGGILFPKHVELGWWHGARYQGGSGAYRADGPRLVRKH